MSASSTHGLVSGTGLCPNFPYFCIRDSSGWASVKVRPWKAGIYPKIGIWSVVVLLGWCFVFGIIMKLDGREPHIVRCHHDSATNKAASLLRLLRFYQSE